VRQFDEIAQRFVPPGEEAFESAHPGVVPLDLDLAVAESGLEEFLPEGGFLGTDLPLPLKGRMGFGDEVGETDGYLSPFLSRTEDLVGQGGDSLQIPFFFPRKADHEVEFHRPPAGGEDLCRGCQEVRFSVPLVDDVAETLSPRFRSQGEACLPDPTDGLDEIPAQGFHPQGGEGQGDAPGVITIHEEGQKRFDAGIIAGAEGQQRKLLLAGGREHLVGHFLQDPGLALPDGAPDHSRLAETAAPGAAPGDLQDRPVMDGLHQRRQRPDGERPGVKIGNDPLSDLFAPSVNGGNIDAGKFGKGGQQLFPAGAAILFPHHDRCHLAAHLFAFSDDKGIDEGRHGGGVETAGAAGDNEGIAVPAVRAAAGNPAQLQHGQDVGERQLVLQGETDEIEIP